RVRSRAPPGECERAESSRGRLKVLAGATAPHGKLRRDPRSGVRAHAWLMLLRGSGWRYRTSRDGLAAFHVRGESVSCARAPCAIDPGPAASDEAEPCLRRAARSAGNLLRIDRGARPRDLRARQSA